MVDNSWMSAKFWVYGVSEHERALGIGQKGTARMSLTKSPTWEFPYESQFPHITHPYKKKKKKKKTHNSHGSNVFSFPIDLNH